MGTEAQFPAERDEIWEIWNVKRNSVGVSKIHGTWINNELIQVCLVFTDGSPVEAGDGVSNPFSNLGEEGIPGRLGYMAFCEDVLSIVPFPGTDPAVSGERGASGSALCGKHAIRQVILTEHLDVDPEFFDIIGGVDVLQDVMGLPLQPMEGDVEETHSAVCQGILPEFPFVVCDNHGGCVGLPGLLGPGRLL